MDKPKPKPDKRIWDKPRKVMIFLPLGNLKPKPAKPT